MKKSVFISVSALAAMTLVSCAGGNKSNNDNAVITKENVAEEVRDFVYPLPTAFQITDMLNEIGADYMLTLCNDDAAVDKYLTESKRAINLGVYSADVCYASTYNQHQTVMVYMEAIKKLIDDLDMTQAVDPELPSKIENNENNKDELTNLITDSFYDAYDYLNKNERGPVSLLIVAGSWTEGLYLATHISEYTFNNKEMVKIVMSQKEPLMKLVELLNKYKGVENIDNMLADLAPLHAIFSQVDEGGISEQQSENIRTAVEAIRSKAVAY
ncbi:MAG: hypothetical protein MJZ15_01055 [Bacteroidales bacterium]|nr:hypothetical protein [Bacteroidales bacterium]